MSLPRTATPRLARAFNDRLTLDLLVEHGELTAPRLRELTGLSRPTVSDVLQRLTDAGLIRTSGIAHADRRPGPRARRYAVVPDVAYVAAADLGCGPGTLHVTDLSNSTVAEIDLSAVVEPAGGAGLEEALRAAGVNALHTVVLAVHDVAVLSPGGSCAGLMAALRAAGCPAPMVESPARAATTAALRAGESRTFALLWLGCCVDLAVVLDGRLYRGVSGSVGALGALRVGTVPVQELLGGAVVRELAHRCGLTRADLAAGTGGHGGRVALAGLAANTATVVAGLAAVLDPGRILLGGELGAEGGEHFAALVRARLAELACPPVEVRPSAAGPAVVREGALLMAQDVARADLWPDTSTPYQASPSNGAAGTGG
ncbi:MarR family transcriptional regulator [Streptomyces sp. NPDC048845]|uniref:MarR family transcriptional regulator n=1 Tax=Streptomyces sp. NPDC048845 TaxID=3155390 RepID=UPI00341442A4